MGRIMGMDYGGKRTGIAVTDPLQIIASPLKTVPTDELFSFLESYLSVEDVDVLVVGQPTRADGSFSDIEKEILVFIEKFSQKHPKVKVERRDESFTSQQAMQALIQSGVKKKKRRDKSLLDSTSATLILRDYLENKL